MSTSDTSTTAPNSLIDDADQQRVIGLQPGHGPVLVVGGPGTGRTTTVIEYVTQRLKTGLAPDEVLVLTNTRVGADRLRNQLTTRLNQEDLSTRARTPVRSFASYAFDLIRRMRAEGLLPTVTEPPRLLAGAEQDQTIAEILETYQQQGASTDDLLSIQWPKTLEQAVGLRGFRQEIRNLIDRCAEYGIEPGDLKRLGQERDRAEWTVMATILEDYRDVLNLGRSEAFDPAGLITTAADLLLAHPEFLEAERQRLPVIVIDDFQDSTPAVQRLVRVLGTDLDLLITFHPDITVQGFRGAQPNLVGSWARELKGELSLTADELPLLHQHKPAEHRVMLLNTGYRMAPAVQQAWERVSRRIPAVPGIPAIRENFHSNTSAEESSAAEVHWVSSPLQEQEFILQQILELNYQHGIPLNDIAVIARTSYAVARIATHLESHGVAVARKMSEMVLSQQPAVKPLLTLITAAANDSEDSVSGLEPAMIPGLLAGVYGTTNALEQRHLRRRLLQAERRREGTRTSTELLDVLLSDPDQFYELLGISPDKRLPKYATGAHRICLMLEAMRIANQEPGATAETVLWAGWEKALEPVGNAWREDALGEDAEASRRGHAHLDAVVGLFDAAERYTEQFAGESAQGFSNYLESQDLPMDSLSERVAQKESVAVLTPSTAVNSEWEAVIIAGVQDGVWPNTKLRGLLLHTRELVEVFTEVDAPESYADQIAEVRNDELRTFAAAISRAKQRVIGTAVINDDYKPSHFLDYISRWEKQRPQDPEIRPVTSVVAPLTVTAQIAQLRKELETAAQTGEKSQRVQDLATALAVLAEHEVSAADPANWWGLQPLSTQDALQGPDAVIAEEASSSDRSAKTISLSPSRVETALKNPMNWLIQQLEGRPGSTTPMLLGTFIHKLAEDFPKGDLEELTVALDERFPAFAKEVGADNDELARAELYEKCEKMIGFFADYAKDSEKLGRTTVALEEKVTYRLETTAGNVQVRGVIDRLEVTPEGRPYIVDLKTGAGSPTKAELSQFPQLGVYQAMLANGALDNSELDIPHPTKPAGALLVQLGNKVKNLKLQEQPELEEHPSWADRDIESVAEHITGPEFLVVHHKKTSCSLKTLCPLCAEGRQVTEWQR